MTAGRVVFFYICCVLFLSFFSNLVYASNDRAAEIEQLSQNHQKVVSRVDAQWGLLRQALQMENQKRFVEARVLYEKLYNEWATSSIRGMAAVGLINVYENLGMYQHSLQLVERMLRVNKMPETVATFQMARQRLIQKIEAQGREGSEAQYSVLGLS